MTEPKSKRQKKYLIREDDEMFLVPQEYFEHIKSRAEAANLGVQIYLEIHRALREEALSQEISYVGRTKVITALKSSLKELENRFPLISDEIRAIDRKIDGVRVFKA